MRLLIPAALLFFHYSSSGQITQYQKLLDTALTGHGWFVHSKPINKLGLDKIDIWHYTEMLKEYSNQTLDTLMFLEIIQNSKIADTTSWKENEIPLSLLVHSREEFVSKKYAVQKLSLTDKKTTRFLSKQITQFNNTDDFYRNITYFSRPVFDNSKSFAVVKWYDGGGGGGIKLYQLKADKWKEVGIINIWKS